MLSPLLLLLCSTGLLECIPCALLFKQCMCAGLAQGAAAAEGLGESVPELGEGRGGLRGKLDQTLRERLDFRPRLSPAQVLCLPAGLLSLPAHVVACAQLSLRPTCALHASCRPGSRPVFASTLQLRLAPPGHCSCAAHAPCQLEACML